MQESSRVVSDEGKEYHEEPPTIPLDLPQPTDAIAGEDSNEDEDECFLSDNVSEVQHAPDFAEPQKSTRSPSPLSPRNPEEKPDSPGKDNEDSPNEKDSTVERESELPLPPPIVRPSVMPPPPPTAPPLIPSVQNAETQEPHEIFAHRGEENKGFADNRIDVAEILASTPFTLPLPSPSTSQPISPVHLILDPTEIHETAVSSRSPSPPPLPQQNLEEGSGGPSEEESSDEEHDFGSGDGTGEDSPDEPDSSIPLLVGRSSSFSPLLLTTTPQPKIETRAPHEVSSGGSEVYEDEPPTESFNLPQPINVISDVGDEDFTSHDVTVEPAEVSSPLPPSSILPPSIKLPPPSPSSPQQALPVQLTSVETVPSPQLLFLPPLPQQSLEEVFDVSGEEDNSDQHNFNERNSSNGESDLSLQPPSAGSPSPPTSPAVAPSISMIDLHRVVQSEESEGESPALTSHLPQQTDVASDGAHDESLFSNGVEVEPAEVSALSPFTLPPSLSQQNLEEGSESDNPSEESRSDEEHDFNEGDSPDEDSPDEEPRPSLPLPVSLPSVALQLPLTTTSKLKTETDGPPGVVSRKSESPAPTFNLPGPTDGGSDGTDNDSISSNGMKVEPMEAQQTAPSPQFPSPQPLFQRDSERGSDSPREGDSSDEEDGPDEEDPGPSLPSPVSLPSASITPRLLLTTTSKLKTKTQEYHGVGPHESEESEGESPALTFDLTQQTDGASDGTDGEIFSGDSGKVEPAGVPAPPLFDFPPPPFSTPQEVLPIKPTPDLMEIQETVPSPQPLLSQQNTEGGSDGPSEENNSVEHGFDEGDYFDEDGLEGLRERRLAELVTGLSDTVFGVPSPIENSQPSPEVHRGAGKEDEGDHEEDEPTDEEERIVTKLEDVGGTQIDMVFDGISPEPSVPPREDTTNTEQPEQRLPPPVEPDTGTASQEDLVNAEVEETSGDEDNYFDAREEAPTISSRSPASGPSSSKKVPANPVTIPSQDTASSRSVPPTPLDYVVVEKHDPEFVPPPSSHSASPPRALSLPPALASNVPDNATAAPLELPRNMETSVTELSTPSRSETFNTGVSQENAVEALPNEKQQSPGQMTADQLKATWRRVGTQVNEVVRELFEKSKKGVVGDGSYVGFVNAVLDKVPNTSTVEVGASSFGYLIYVQTGPSVTRRVADIMPGDIIVLQDAKLKGHKGLKTYHQNAGQGTPVVAIIDEHRSRKSTVKTYQACQQAGNQVRHTMG